MCRSVGFGVTLAPGFTGCFSRQAWEVRIHKHASVLIFLSQIPELIRPRLAFVLAQLRVDGGCTPTDEEQSCGTVCCQATTWFLSH